MTVPVITADFNNADVQGRLRLNPPGAVRDFVEQGVHPEDGLQLVFRDDDIEADGELVSSADEGIWVAKIDWDAIRRAPRPA